MKSLSGLEIEFLVTFSKLGNLSLGIQRRLNKDRAWEKNSASIKNTGKTRLTYNCAHLRSTKEKKEENIWRKKIFFAEGTINEGGKGG